ncbi:MAG: MBL fold metallo-hydrolase [Thermodesulfobacteriota bacterium]
MRFCVLGSGSRGNATYVASESGALLIDNGFSAVEIERRLAAIGIEAASLSAILLTHEHNDHLKGVGVLARKFGLPLHASAGTIAAAARTLAGVEAVHPFTTGTSFFLAGFSVHPFAVCHDTADPVGFVIRHDLCSLGYCTDTGTVSRVIRHHLAGCNGLVLECNHDPRMLQNGPYPLQLKQRVRSRHGHLANDQTAALIGDILHEKLFHVVLAHISETNNDPALALDTVAAAAATAGAKRQVVSLSWQDRPGEMIDLGHFGEDDDR